VPQQQKKRVYKKIQISKYGKGKYDLGKNENPTLASPMKRE